MNPALVLIALEEPGQSYQAEVPLTLFVSGVSEVKPLV